MKQRVKSVMLYVLKQISASNTVKTPAVERATTVSEYELFVSHVNSWGKDKARYEGMQPVPGKNSMKFYLLSMGEGSRCRKGGF